MQGPQFKFCFKPAPTSYYNVTGAGSGAVVGITGTQTFILTLPKGWEETELTISRDPQVWGLMTEVTNTYKFTKDAAKILRYVHATQGVNGYCIIEIWKQNSNQWDYSPYYTGELVFSTFQDEGDYVSINIEQGGVNGIINRDISKLIEIDLQTGDSHRITLDGVNLQNRTMLRMTTPFGMPRTGNHIMPQILKTSEESAFISNVVEYNQSVVETQLNISTNYPFFIATAFGQLNLTYDVTLTLQVPSQGTVPNADFRVTVSQFRNGSPVSGSPSIIYAHSSTNINGTFSFSGAINLNIQPGDRIAIASGWAGLDGNPQYDLEMNWQKGIFQATYNARQVSTNTPAYRFYQVVEKAAAILTGGLATVPANILSDVNAILADSRPAFISLAPSEAVRGITVNNKFKLTWADIEKALLPFGLGISIIGNEIRIKRITEFFNDTPIFGFGFNGDLGDVSNVKIVPALPYLWTKLKVGYKVGDDDALNARYEINGPQEWGMMMVENSTNVSTKSENELDISSPFFSGQYSIENIRSDRLKDTTNTSADNRILLFETNSTPVAIPNVGTFYGLYRPQNDAGNYVYYVLAYSGDTAFNLTLSPARDILRNEARVAVQRALPGIIKFLQFFSADREGNLYSKLGPAGLVEERMGLQDSHPNIGANPPFLPLMITCNAAEPIGLYAAMQANPHGYLTFNYNNRQFKGYIHEIKRKPGINAAMECQLLLHPSTDLTGLY